MRKGAMQLIMTKTVMAAAIWPCLIGGSIACWPLIWRWSTLVHTGPGCSGPVQPHCIVWSGPRCQFEPQHWWSSLGAVITDQLTTLPYQHNQSFNKVATSRECLICVQFVLHTQAQTKNENQFLVKLRERKNLWEILSICLKQVFTYGWAVWVRL